MKEQKAKRTEIHKELAMKRWFLSVCLIVIVGSATLHAQPIARPTPLYPNFWGMVVRDPEYEWNTNPAYPNAVNQAFVNAMLDNLQAIGVEWLRFEFHAINDGSEYGAFNMAQADYFIQAARARGFKIIAVLGTDILRGTKASVVHFDGGTASGIIPDTNPDAEFPCPNPPPSPIGCGVNAYQKAWLERAIAIAQAYQGRIDAYEIFNEPNHYFAMIGDSGGTKDEMNPYYVAQTITKFYRITRERNDQSLVIVGGLHPRTSFESGRTDRAYLAELYKAKSFSEWNLAKGRYPIDGVSYHPYPVEMRRPVSDNDFLYLIPPRLDALIATMRTYDQNAKLWLTEIGTRGDPNSPADMQRQADFMGAIVGIAYAKRNDIAAWFWFKYEDFPSEAWGIVHIPYDANGKYDLNGTVQIYKPAYDRYRQLLENYRERIWIPLAIGD